MYKWAPHACPTTDSDLKERSMRVAVWLVCLVVGALIVLLVVLPAIGPSGFMVRRMY